MAVTIAFLVLIHRVDLISDYVALVDPILLTVFSGWLGSMFLKLVLIQVDGVGLLPLGPILVESQRSGANNSLPFHPFFVF